jgi:HD-GYP domain-containing protein (c-di-GMP phosphodiesterase class II)
MHKIKIKLADCKIGNILAKDIISGSGMLLVAKNTIINSFILLKLSEIGISFAYIYDLSHNGNKLQKKYRQNEFKSNYLDTVVLIKEILDSLISRRRLEPEKIGHLADCIFENINDADCVISLLNGLKDFDDYTYYHSMNVAFYAMLIGKWSHMPKAEIMDLILSGCLHDIGKTMVPDEILNKRGRLTEAEFEEIKKHSYYGYVMLKSDDSFSNDIKDAVLSHHERIDGSGYPKGSRGQSIGKYAKIIAIADVYDAMTSERVYKHRVTPFEAFRMFSATGTALFDPYLVRTFLSNMSAHMVGLKVEMSDGMVGEVVYVPYHDIANPVVHITTYIDM